MSKSVFRRALALLLCIILLATSRPAKADSLQKTANEIVAGIVGVSAAIVVVTVILVVHYKGASVKGCVASGPDGLQLTNSSDTLTYQLAGDTSNIKPGEMVKLKGKKKAAKSGAQAAFTVKQLSKDYGACPAAK